MAKQKNVSEIRERKQRARSAVTSFIRRLASSRISLMLRPPERPEHEIRSQRLRAEFAESLLGSLQYQETIQMLNEQTVQELVGTKDRDERDRLVIRLDVISDFQWLLRAHIDEYETTRLIHDEQLKREEQTRSDAYGGSTE